MAPVTIIDGKPEAKVEPTRVDGLLLLIELERQKERRKRIRVAEQTTTSFTFAQIKSRAEWSSRQLWESGNPVVTVGTATCGRAAGALEVVAAIRDEVDKSSLVCPVIEVGCMGHCYAEPVVTIHKPGYPTIDDGRVNPVIAPQLVRNYILGNDPCPEFVLGALEENDLVPSFADFPAQRMSKRLF